MKAGSGIGKYIRTVLGVGLCLMAGAACAAPTAAPAVRMQLGQPNAARFPNVTLYAYPTDARGVLLGGLRPEDFRVTEDGAPAEVLGVEADGGVLEVCLALDRSPSMLDDRRFEHALSAAHTFLRQLAPKDRAALITFSNGSTLEQKLTSDRTVLHTALDRVRISGDTTTFLDAVYWSITQVALQPHGGSVTGLSPARPDARRIVLALTDGHDMSSRTSPEEIIRYALANGVSLYMVGVGRDASINQLQQLAAATGGAALYAPSPRDLEGLYASLARQLRTEYRVTIRSPRPQADKTRREVRVSLSYHPSASAVVWYEAPAMGTLLALGTNTEAQSGAPVVGAAGDRKGKLPAGLLLGVLLLSLGGLGLGAIAWAWWRSRNQLLPIVDSNPRLDLLPLWVREGQTRVGRGAECDVVLDSRQVSRVHAVIEAQAGAYHLIDEESRNGTYVNGKRVRRMRQLQVGDVVRFGDREFRFAGALTGHET